MAIGRLFHIIHMTDDLAGTEAWYEDVFCPYPFMESSYAETLRRDASLVLLGDCVIEPLAPHFEAPDWAEYPLGRFFSRFGSHWHSLAFYTDDIPAVWRRAHDFGIRVVGNEGASVGVIENEEQLNDPSAPTQTMNMHPKDAFTQIEIQNVEVATTHLRDPRLVDDPNYDPEWWIKNHPVKTPGLAYTTVTVPDLDRAGQVYVEGLGGTLLHKGESDLTGTSDVYVQLGDTVVQLSRPTRDGTLAAQDFAKFGSMHHAAAFKVQDLDATKEYFDSKGIATLARDDQTLITDPATTKGVPFRWTTWDVPGGPRDTAR
jgi:catechol 2,3-dioxygenase-like lactoylglutathione lyase family enzyme